MTKQPSEMSKDELLAPFGEERGNSEYWHSRLMGADDKAFCMMFEYYLRNCQTYYRPSTYNESVLTHYAPELLRRHWEALQQADELKETIARLRRELEAER